MGGIISKAKNKATPESEGPEEQQSRPQASTPETTDTEADYRFTADDIAYLTEILARVAHKWKEIAIALKLTKVQRVECGSDTALTIKLNNVLEKWVEGMYDKTASPTLQNLKKALAGDIVREGVLANEIEQKILNQQKHEKCTTTLLYNACYYQQLITRYRNRPEVLHDSWLPVATKKFINLALIKSSSERTNKTHYSVRGDADDVIATKERIEYEKALGQYESGITILVLGRPGSGKTTLVHKVCKDWAKGKALKEADLVFLISLRVVNTLNDHSSLAELLKPYYFKKSSDIVKIIEDKDGRGVCFIFDGFDEYQCKDEKNSVVYALFNKSYLPQAMVIMSSRPAAAASAKLQWEPSDKRIEVEVFGFTKEQIYEYIDSFPFNPDGSHLTSHCSNLKSYLKSNPQVLHMCYLPVNAAIICCLYDNEPNNMPHTQTKIYETFTRSIILRSSIRSDRIRYLRSLEELTGEDAEHFYNICLLAYNRTINSQQVISQDTINTSNTCLGLVTTDITASLYGFQNTYTFLHLTLQEFLAAYHISRLPLSQQMKIIDENSEHTELLTVWKFYSGLVDFSNNLDRLERIFKNISKMKTTLTLFKLQCAYESRQESVCKLASSESLQFTETITASDMSALAYVMSTTAASYTQDTSTSTKPTTKLTFFYCHLDDDQVMTLFMQLSHEALRYLEILEMTYANFTSNSFEAIANLLQQTKLRELRLNSVGSLKINMLFPDHTYYGNLTHLSLSNNNIECDCTEVLARALPHTQIQELDLSSNRIKDNGARALATELMKTKLKQLTISENKISDDGAIALATGLVTNTELQTLHLSVNNICYEGAMALLDALVHNTTLIELNLSWNDIGRTSGRVCPSKQTQLPTTRSGGLKKLDISGNKINVDTAMTISDHVIHNYTHLEKLNLCKHNIDSNGVIDVCLKLLHHINIHALTLCADKYYYIEQHTLNLSYNGLTSENAIALANGIQQINWKTPLLHNNKIRLSNNYIDQHGAEALLTALKTHNCKEVDLQNNPIETDSQEELQRQFGNFFLLHLGTIQL